MGLITKQEFSTELANEFNGVVKDVGDKTALETTEKTNLVLAINEAFQFANNGKTDIASVIGSPATAGNTFAQLKTHIQDSKNILATNLTNAGQASVGTETLSALAAKVANAQSGIGGEQTSTGEFKETILKGDAIQVREKMTNVAPFDIDPASASSSGVYFSPTNDYLAVKSGLAPYILFYKRVGNSFVKLPNPDVLPAAHSYHKSAWSSDGLHFYHGDGIIYKRNGDSFTKLAYGTTLLTGNILYNSALGHVIGAFGNSLVVFVRSGDTYTHNTSLMPGGMSGIADVAISDDGIYLAFVGALGTNNDVPTLHLRKWNGSSYVSIANPTAMPNGGINKVALSKNGEHLALGLQILSAGNITNDYLHVYKRTGDNFSKLNISDTRASVAHGLSYSPDGKTLYTAGQQIGSTSSNPGRLKVYRVSGDLYSVVANPDFVPNTSILYSMSVSNDNKFMAFVHGSMVVVYNIATGVYKSYNSASEILAGPVGYAKESGQAGQTKQISLVWR